MVTSFVLEWLWITPVRPILVITAIVLSVFCLASTKEVAAKPIVGLNTQASDFTITKSVGYRRRQARQCYRFGDCGPSYAYSPPYVYAPPPAYVEPRVYVPAPAYVYPPRVYTYPYTLPYGSYW